ncbi:MAG TPA: PilZ domain-containing protein [Steroidobacteraceae bacterium]|nr:PilZ domain-containing protein [Steroidobacteraceae bacterium]
MMDISHGLEHRWGERVRVNMPVRLSAADLPSVEGRVKNLSLSGALLKVDCELRLHALIEVRIELPPPASRAAVVEAHVSRKLDDGVGIEWCQLAPNIVRVLLRDQLLRHPA